MKIHRLSAVFGRLRGETLELGDGLNILRAPNESGKSTWCALLTAMLYGVNSRERDRTGVLAEKNRYAPWDGAAMSGRMDCSSRFGEVTLLRETRRQTAPMGAFSALRSGTAEPIPELSAGNCGEALLGVSREVFERSAMIRQSGLGITPSAELERRILSLVTTGEEGNSYTEASDALRRQRNRRKHNRTGRIPELEAERDELRRKREDLAAQRRQLSEAEAQLQRLEAFQRQAEQSLRDAQRYAAVERRRGLDALRAQAEEKDAALTALRTQAEAERLPENDAIARLRGALVNLETVRRQLTKARETRDEAMKAVLRAEQAVSESPFAGESPQQARQEAAQPPKVSVNVWPSLLVFLLFLAAAAGSFMLVNAVSRAPLTGWLRILPWVAFAAVAAGGTVVSHLMRTHAIAKARAAALQKRFGTADPAEIEALADRYEALCQARDAAQRDCDGKSAAANALYETLRSNEQAILLEVRRFAPEAFDAASADAALRRCAQKRRALSEAEAAAREARLRYDLTAKEAGDGPLSPEDLALPAPEHTEDELRAARDTARLRAAEVRARADRLQGAMAAGGSEDALSAREAELTAEITRLQGEYDALTLAMDALAEANTDLQNRFSPALGRRAAEIFAQLTDGRYDAVALDRSFRLAAEPQGSYTPRDAQYLSAGALDQLYLAVRLAICELALPQGDPIPLILDDALTNFDDSRCAAALRFLRQEAESRQVLLFTCHSREAEFFRDDPAVRIQQLG